MKKRRETKIKFKQKIKLKKIVRYFAYFIITICVLYNILFLINTTISSKEYFKLFGFSIFNMNNNLMSGDINKNDLVIAKEVENQKLKEGDIIVYQIHGQIKINKIFNITDEGYVTKYNQGYYLDREIVTDNQIIGKTIINVPILGKVSEVLQSKITSIIVIIILLLAYSYTSYKSDKKIERYRKRLLIKKKKGRKNVSSKGRRI